MHSRRTSWSRSVCVVSTIALVATLSAVAAGTSSAAGRKTSATPFNVLAILPTSGPLAAIGAIEAKGAKAAAAVINKQGGILGHPVVVKVADDAADGTKAVTALQQELAKGTKYNLLILGAFDQDAAPLLAASKKNSTLQVSGSSVVYTAKQYPSAFNTGSGFPPNAEAMILKMKQDGITKFAILCGDDGSGRDGAKALQQSAKAHGLTVTTSVFVPDSATDATPQYQQVQGSSPQAIAIAGYTPADPMILKARTKLGDTTRIYGDAFFGDFNFSATNTPTDLQGVMVENFPWLVQGDPATKTKPWKEFYAAFHPLDPHPIVTIAAAMTCYWAVLVARAAAIAAKSIDAPALAKAMPTIHLSSQVPSWFGPKKIYSATSHALLVGPSDMKFYKAVGQKDGLFIPGK